MAAQPAYYDKPNTTGGCNISAANTAADGTGTIVPLFGTVSASGTMVQDLFFSARATTTAGMIRMYRYDGSAWTFLLAFPVSAVTPSASIPQWSQMVPNLGILLKAGSGLWQNLGFSTHNAESFNISCSRAADA